MYRVFPGSQFPSASRRRELLATRKLITSWSATRRRRGSVMMRPTNVGFSQSSAAYDASSSPTRGRWAAKAFQKSLKHVAQRSYRRRVGEESETETIYRNPFTAEIDRRKTHLEALPGYRLKVDLEALNRCS